MGKKSPVLRSVSYNIANLFGMRPTGTPMFAIARELVHLLQGKAQYQAGGFRAAGGQMRKRRLRMCGLGTVLAGVALAGCSSVSGDRGGVFDRTLYVLGLQRSDALLPQAPAAASAQVGQSAPQRMVLRLHAGQMLNLSGQGQPLSVVVRLFKLRERSAFELAPYAAFHKGDSGQYPDLSGDILESRELVLTPGQKYEVVETLGVDVRYFAVAVLFRQAAEQRWRFIFDAKAAAATGITMGLHGCAASVAAGQPLDMPIELMRVAGVRCDSPSG
jgi:type VI secretion system protein VasD